MKQLATKVRTSRTRQKRSQAEIASKVLHADGRPYSRAWLVALEQGRANNVPAEALTALAIALGDDPADYLRLAGRTVLNAEGVVPSAPLDPRVAEAIEQAVRRAMKGLEEQLVAAVGAAVLRTHTSAGGSGKRALQRQ